MNGIPVSPERKTENAPTWRSPNPDFGTPFWGIFLLFFYLLTHQTPAHTRLSQRIIQIQQPKLTTSMRNTLTPNFPISFN